MSGSLPIQFVIEPKKIPFSRIPKNGRMKRNPRIEMHHKGELPLFVGKISRVD